MSTRVPRTCLEGKAITWVSRCGDECLDLAEVEVDRLVDLRIRIRVHDHRLRLLPAEAAMLRQIPDQRLCGFHNGGQGVAFDRHIGQDGLFLEGEFGEPRSENSMTFPVKVPLSLPS